MGGWGNMLVLPDIMLWVSIWHLEPNFFSVQGDYMDCCTI